MSPPAVSQQIRALEGHLGCALFDRAAAGVHVTEEGRQLLAEVGPALNRMELAASALANPEDVPLVVGVSSTLLVGWLAPRLAEFVQTYPSVKLDLHSLLGPAEAPPRRADLWIAFGAPGPGTDAERLFGERLVPVAHPEIASAVENLEDLLDHQLIQVGDHRRNWPQVFGADALPSGARLIGVDTTAAAMALAASRVGVALARPPASDELVTAYGLVPCLELDALRGVEDYYVAKPSGSVLDANGTLFWDWVTRKAARSVAP